MKLKSIEMTIEELDEQLMRAWVSGWQSRDTPVGRMSDDGKRIYSKDAIKQIISDLEYED